MKPLGFFLLLVAAVFTVLGIRAANQQAHEAQRTERERLIAQHHVVLLMTMPEVERSLGPPVSRTHDPSGLTIWHYPDHQIVFDSKDRVMSVADSLLPQKDPPSKLHSGSP